MLVSVYIMGSHFRVPADATIMGAIEYAGFQIKRGAGCREGYCGACATVYRLPNDYKIYTGLACTTLVKDGMYLAQMPSIPAVKPTYDIEKLKPSVETFQNLYPEVFRCVACNTCTKSCTQELQTMDYIQAIKQNDIPKAMDLSFDCISCGLCAIRCPAEIVHYNAGMLAKRLYGRYFTTESPELTDRIREVEEKKFDEEYEVMMKMPKEELSKKYYARDTE